MLAKLELWIEYEQEEKLTYNISSLMHGILMEQLDPIYGEVLHRNGQKPFHQSVSEMRKNHFKWTICTLNVEARKQIIDVLVTKKHFYMKHKDLKLKVTKWNLSGSSYDELIEKYYFQKNASKIRGLMYWLNRQMLLDWPDIKYFNLGEDMGIKGIREDKSSLRPVELKKKYTVEFI